MSMAGGAAAGSEPILMTIGKISGGASSSAALPSLQIVRIGFDVLIDPVVDFVSDQQHGECGARRVGLEPHANDYRRAMVDIALVILQHRVVDLDGAVPIDLVHCLAGKEVFKNSSAIARVLDCRFKQGFVGDFRQIHEGSSAFLRSAALETPYPESGRLPIRNQPARYRCQ